jgi:hypothetical protein
MRLRRRSASREILSAPSLSEVSVWLAVHDVKLVLFYFELPAIYRANQAASRSANPFIRRLL